MDSLPLAIIPNILIIGLFAVYWGMVFLILYHLMRFGVGVEPKKFAAIFFLGSVVLFCASLIFYLKLDFALLLTQI
ncbi:MAG: hypothetical protein Q7K26_00135 [bacterium]|nr:hypothetical protein [bacterium]